MSHFLDCSKEALALARPYRWPGGPWHAGGKLPDQPLPVGPSRPLAREGEVAVPAPKDQRLGDGASDHGHHGRGAKTAGEEREPGSCLPALVIGYGRQPLGNKGGWVRRVTWLPRKAMAGDPADPADI